MRSYCQDADGALFYFWTWDAKYRRPHEVGHAVIAMERCIARLSSFYAFKGTQKDMLLDTLM